MSTRYDVSTASTLSIERAFERQVEGISEKLLEWKGIEATVELAKSPNAKIVVVGNPKPGLPLIFGADR
jgi:hypothetical protein